MRISHRVLNNSITINHTSENILITRHSFQSINSFEVNYYSENHSFNVTHYSKYGKDFKYCRKLVLGRFGMKGDKIIYKNQYNGIYISKAYFQDSCYILLNSHVNPINVPKNDIKFLKK